MPAGKAWASIASNEMLTYGDVQRAIDDGILQGSVEPPFAFDVNQLISEEMMAQWVKNKILVSDAIQIVWKGAVVV